MIDSKKNDVCEHACTQHTHDDFTMHCYILEKWFPLWGERAHSLKLFCMYDKRFEI